MVNFARCFEKHDILIFCNLFILDEHPAIFLYELVLFDLNTGNWDLTSLDSIKILMCALNPNLEYTSGTSSDFLIAGLRMAVCALDFSWEFY